MKPGRCVVHVFLMGILAVGVAPLPAATFAASAAAVKAPPAAAAAAAKDAPHKSASSDHDQAKKAPPAAAAAAAKDAPHKSASSDHDQAKKDAKDKEAKGQKSKDEKSKDEKKAKNTAKDTKHTKKAKDTKDADDSATPHVSQAHVVGWLELSGPLRDGPAPFAWAADEEPSLRDVLGQLHTVAQGEQYLGVIVDLDRPELSLAQSLAIADAMQKVRDADKKVFTFADAYDMKSYLLGCSADMILLQHKGEVQLNGLSMEEMYLAGLLKKIGVKADLLQVGKYKGASEPMMRTGPSDAWSENISGLLDDMYAQVLARLESGRDMNKDQAEKAIADSWALSAQQLLKRRIVDRLAGRDLTGVTAVQFGNDFTYDDTMGLSRRTPSMPSNPFGLFQMLFRKPHLRTHKPTIAVIHAYGEITSEDSTTGGGLLGSASIGSRTMLKLLGKADDDDHVKGVILRIDSPGGSALASEVIWQAVRELGEDKPVYASVGRMAASGGYYIISATHEVYASPASILGSIGVVGGKITFGGLYDKLGIHVTHRSRGPMSDMFNSVTPFTKAQRKMVHKSMEQVYHQFQDRVKTGRGKRVKNLDKVDAGRVFTGREAIHNGLADKLGGLDLALSDMAKKLHLKEGQYDVMHLPGPMSLQEFLNATFTPQASAAKAPSISPSAKAVFAAARRLMGPRAWRAASASLDGLMLLRREPVLTLFPQAIVVR